MSNLKKGKSGRNSNNLRSEKNRFRKDLDNAARSDMDNITRVARDQLSHVATEYLHAVVSPRTAKPCGIPTLIGGEPGLTGKVKLKSGGSMAVGLNGTGFLVIGHPGYDGFYSDRMLGIKTEVGWAGTAVPAIVAANAVSIVEPGSFTAVSNVLGDIVTTRLVGLEVTIIPIGSALSQNGEILLLEPPNHDSLSLATFAELRSFNNVRRLSGIKFGDYKEQITLNIHPRSHTERVDVPDYGPFDFINQTAGNLSSLTNGMSGIIAVSADAGTEFSYSIVSIYECRGKRVRSVSPTLTDERGMDLVCNVFRYKKLSGYVEDPFHVMAAYFAKSIHVRTKTEHGRTNVKKFKDLWEAGKWAWSTVREIGGF